MKCTKKDPAQSTICKTQNSPDPIYGVSLALLRAGPGAKASNPAKGYGFDLTATVPNARTDATKHEQYFKYGSDANGEILFQG